MMFIGRLVVGFTSGAVIAFTLTNSAVYGVHAMRGNVADAPVALDPSTIGIVCGNGALVGIVAGVLDGRIRLAAWVVGAAKGAVAGVAAVVLSTLLIACSLGGDDLETQAPYLQAGLFCVPIGLIAGAVGGLVISLLRRTGIREGGVHA